MQTSQNHHPTSNNGYTRLIVAIITVSVTLHLIALFLSATLFQGWAWENVYIHSAAEVSGGCMALLVAAILILQEANHEGGSFNLQIAAALGGMGILDIFHAVVPPGDLFVWLHSLATFVGGIVFLTIWIPRRLFVPSYSFPLMVVIGSSLAGFASIVYPEILPAMIYEGSFTLAAELLNFIGGVALLIATVQLGRTFRKTRKIDDLLFCLHSLLFGLAAIMFQQSVLWDLTWWAWHVLRFGAYLVAAWLIIYVLKALFHNLTATNEILRKQNESLNLFTHLTSHDLQTPCRKQAMLADVVLLSEENNLSPLGAIQLEKIKSHATDLRELVNAFHLLATNQAQKLKKESFNMNELAQECLAKNSDDVAESNVRVDWDYDISAYKSIVRLLIENAIKNALKHGNSPLDLRFYSESNEAERTFHIENSADIDSKTDEDLFSAYKQSKQSTEGLGLGLNICSRAVACHNGDIWYEAGDGKFRLSFTLAN